LFVSVHADYLRQRGVRGATVYTISEKASDQVAAMVAANENLADSVAGVELPEDKSGVSDILIDLARRETLGFSVQFARLAISDMRGFARLIKNPHRYAGFRVLKAPDVPSVLIELGYLSNAEDEQLLNEKEWREGLAERLADAIEKFAALSSRDLVVRAGQD
jgi:N-acetylmuramoyl-L-alanine amidase